MTEFIQHESGIVVPSQAPHDTDIRNRERRALRGPSKRERLDKARAAQKASGLVVRLERKVENQGALVDQSRIWHPAVRDGIATAKRRGAFSLTIFDTKQQPLVHPPEYLWDKELLTEKIAEEYPGFFEPTGLIAMTGIKLFGNKKERPFVGLTPEYSDLNSEQHGLLRIVAPELALDRSHQNDHELHVSLGQYFVPGRAEEIMDDIWNASAKQLAFKAGTISIEHS